MLFVSANYSSFVRQDAIFFEEHFEVARFEFGVRKSFQMVWYQIKLLVWLLQRIKGTDVVFIWFADYYSLLPTLVAKLFRKQSFLVIGGYDAARLPEYGYGGHTNLIRSWMIRKSCTWAYRILLVSKFVEQELKRQIGDFWVNKGIVVYNGVDSKIFDKKGELKEPRNGVICVSIAETENRARIKGLDLLLKVASSLPDINFTLVGISGKLFETLSRDKPQNLTIVGKVEHHELLNYFQSAKVVCQFSRFESFGMALAEGMLSGCIPVASPGTGAAEIIDENCGVVAPSYEVMDLVAATTKAIKLNETYSYAAQRRIRDHFGLPLRNAHLMNVLSDSIS